MTTPQPPVSIAVGDAGPPLERTIGLPDMVAYAGATWDWHRMHYDRDRARELGLPAPVVDGQVLGALLAEQMQDWLGPRARLHRLHFRFVGLVYAGETVRCESTVLAVDGDVVSLDGRVVVVADPERIAVAPAGAQVRLHPVGADR